MGINGLFHIEQSQPQSFYLAIHLFHIPVKFLKYMFSYFNRHAYSIVTDRDIHTLPIAERMYPDLFAFIVVVFDRVVENIQNYSGKPKLIQHCSILKSAHL